MEQKDINDFFNLAINDDIVITRMIEKYYTIGTYKMFCYLIEHIANEITFIDICKKLSCNIKIDILDKYFNADDINEITKFRLFYYVCYSTKKYILKMLYRMKNVDREIVSILQTEQIFTYIYAYKDEFLDCLITVLSKDDFNRVLDFILRDYKLNLDGVICNVILLFLINKYVNHQYFDVGLINKMIIFMGVKFNSLPKGDIFSNNLNYFLTFCVDNNYVFDYMVVYHFMCLALNCVYKEHKCNKFIEFIFKKLVTDSIVISETSREFIKNVIKLKHLLNINKYLLNLMHENSCKFSREEMAYIDSLPIEE